MRPVQSYLRGSARPLAEDYDVALLDLDGVVYIGPDAVPGAPEALAAARRAGMRLAFVTNNAARTPDVVAEHLTELGIDARPSEVVTSAQAAARYLAEHLPTQARVLVVGTTGLEEALRERHLVPVPDAQGHVDAVVQGYSPDLTWRLLAEGAVAINRGVPWVATNADPTVPSPRGRLPGNGALVAALRVATGVEPVVTGKPDPAMHRESLLRSQAQHPIVVGDRLDTDVEGANAVGCDSLLVLSGVTSPRELLQAAPRQRPTYLAADVGGLLQAHPEFEVDADRVTCGSWRATADRGRGSVRLTLTALRHAGGGSPSPAADLDALRALCAASWQHPEGDHVVAAGGDDERLRFAAEQALQRLGLLS
jgi:glycerol 3-phosphatase-2